MAITATSSGRALSTGGMPIGSRTEFCLPVAFHREERTIAAATPAAAGGVGEFARRDAVHVLRYQVPLGEVAPARIRLGYRALLRGERPAAAFRLREGDVVVVE